MAGMPDSTRERVRHRQLRLVALVLLAVLPLAAAGCTTRYVSIRKVPDSPLVDRFKLTSRHGPEASPRTVQVLRRFDLENDLRGDQRRLLERLQEKIAEEPSAEKVYALAEVAYLAGKRSEKDDPQSALDFYGASVAYSYLYLFDRRFSDQITPYDPRFRAACDLYNGALEDCLRIVRRDGTLSPGQTHTIQSCNHTWEVTVVARGQGWQRDSFDRFEFASDYDVRGVTNTYRNYGLGVPLIAVRDKRREGDATEKFYPSNLSFPVTAFLRVLPDDAVPGAGPCTKHRSVLELYDPLMTNELAVDNRPVPLESDLTTPLAYFLDQGKLPPLAIMGLLRPDESQKLRGLYMAQPYEPDKIPVLFVHGLWSDPRTWTEMFNDLRAAPEVRANYQFWFYFYPSGQPFWYSAAQLRKDLAELRQQVDPQRRTATMDQMVLVGHSMGGLVSRLQMVDSGDDFWRTASAEPFPVVKASYETREALEKTYYFQANPSVRRVITIGTPHRGSQFANSYTRFLAEKLIAFPRMLVEGQQELYRENPEAFGKDSSVRVNTSVDSLAPDSPFLPVMLAAHRAPWVHQHNIVGVTELGEHGELPPNPTDGVVPYSSAHLDDVESERVVRADHSGVHRHPLSVLEVRRILLEHLADVRAGRGGGPEIQLVGPGPSPPVRIAPQRIQPPPLGITRPVYGPQPAPLAPPVERLVQPASVEFLPEAHPRGHALPTDDRGYWPVEPPASTNPPSRSSESAPRGPLFQGPPPR